MYGCRRDSLRLALAMLTAVVTLPASALSFLPWENVRITFNAWQSFGEDGGGRGVRAWVTQWP